MSNLSPPDPAVTYVRESLTALYNALEQIRGMGVPAVGSQATLGGAIQSVNALLTDWYLNGVG